MSILRREIRRLTALMRECPCGCPNVPPASPSSNLCGHCLMRRPCPRGNPGAPSTRALSRWYDAQPDRDYKCTDCGRVGPKHYIQPQHPFYADGREDVARCSDCISRLNREARTRRRQQLASEPRCDVPACGKRGAWDVAGVLLCGAHKRRARDSYAMLGVWGGVAPQDRASILKAAQS